MSRSLVDSTRCKILAANMLRLSAAEEVRKTLLARGIPLLYLKGAAFLDTLYPDLGERPMCDIDVLVPARQQHAAAQILKGLGFRRSGPLHRPATYEEHFEWVYLRDKPFPFTFEVHRGFCQTQRYGIDYDALWKRHVVYRCGDRVIPTLSPEDSLLHASLHEAMHSFIIDGRSAQDIKRIIEVWKPNWNTVITRAKQWQMTLALYISLHASIRQWGTIIPSEVMAELRPGKMRHMVLGLLLDMEHTGRARPQKATRAWQLLSMLATEAPLNLARFGAYYGHLRARDMLLKRRGHSKPTWEES